MVRRLATPLRSLRRKYISVQIKRELFGRAQSQCEYRNSVTGTRCNSKHFLEIDHRVPVANGGTDKIENLRILCRDHNTYEALRWGLKRPEGHEGVTHSVRKQL